MVEQLPYDVCVRLHDRLAWIHKQAVKDSKRTRVAGRPRPVGLREIRREQSIDITAEAILRLGSEVERLAEGLGIEDELLHRACTMAEYEPT